MVNETMVARGANSGVNGSHQVLNGANGTNGTHPPDYSMLRETRKTLDTLLRLAKDQIPDECLPIINNVEFTTANTGSPYFPSPFKQTEATSALKAVEAGVAASIANIAYGERKRRMVVDLERASAFLFSTYLATVNGMNKSHPKVKALLKDTDLLHAQSILYRRLSANLYETKNPGEYFHLHGSLEATTALNMVGLEGFRPDMTDYHECIKLIEDHVKRYTAEELEELNAKAKQAGVTCMKWENFKATNHGQELIREPPWRVETLETSSPPVPFPTSSEVQKPQILSGIRVLELCRIIAGPAIGRGLAEYGADVIKVTSPNLSDVPFFQVDGNLGKHTVDLDLRSSCGRKIFEDLLQSADVIIDGYRPGSLERLGYGPRQIVELTRHRRKGIVYIAEDCFGHVGEWASRPGWQQIADCVTGVAWYQGLSMGLNEPVVPPFPMSDYGTGCMGTIAALVGLYKRARLGGSYFGTTSLCQYDIYLLQVGLHTPEIIAQLREAHDPEFYELRHHDSVDEVGKRALNTMRRVHPELFEDRHMQECYSQGFKASIKVVKPVVHIEGTWHGFLRSSRPNGFDMASWEGWEVDEGMLKE
ncbi:alpha-methylacyl-CoA racemase [Lepidopterella palustris CBS 459.81]|uniref:Alpha-methylacyl-CoA racemase n=1 Tax=Lepidopterella palustris CBS 459.81 TaxID=1314670 RepID=A0A8E2E703_9PEZI|nr:alpha-methylacyl-CoA racemase [Lepidopterella palustris CBS 459.81]